MKRMLTFVPLAVGIRAALIYIFNIIQFRMVGNAITLLDAITKLRIYLYIAIAGFVLYFLLKLFFTISERRKTKVVKEVITEDAYEPFEEIKKEDAYTPNYDYVPIYNKEEKEEKKVIIKEVVSENVKYFFNCN